MSGRLRLAAVSAPTARNALGILAGGLVIPLLVYSLDGDSEKPGVIAAVSAFMMVAGLLAALVPASRGLRIQPTEALREA